MRLEYPLFRIELLSVENILVAEHYGEFQYPLFRIELLSNPAAYVW